MKSAPSRQLALSVAALSGFLATFAANPAGAQEAGKEPRPAAEEKPAGDAGGENANDADGAIPPALTEYRGRTIAQTMHWLGAEWLLRQEREREEATTVMIEQLKLAPGMTVCDMGSGNGYHSLMMAKAVGPEGKVVAVDIQEEMLKLLQARARAANVENIETILSVPHDAKLPPDAFDLILLVDVYHEFSHPEQMLQGMRRALKPDGVIALVEFRLEDESVPIKLLHKMSKEQILKEYVPMGFKLVRSFDELPWQHLMFFGKDAAPAPEAPAAPAPPAPPAKHEGDE